MVNKVRTIDFLPEVFRTYSNRQFLDATLDVLTSQPNLRRVEGFIGEKYGYGVEPTDRYVVEPTKSRRDYQLDPSVVFLKPDTQTAKDFISYPGMLNALNLNNGNVDNPNRLFENQFYSWDPFIVYDKIVNYSMYHWLPNGPDAVPVTTNVVYLENLFTVESDDNGYRFENIDGLNPEITLIRGGTYTFYVPNKTPNFTNFWLQKVPGTSATNAQRTIPGVTNNGTNNGVITFVVPDRTTLNDDVLFYQSGSEPLSVGRIKLIDTNNENYINVDAILASKNYTSPNGVPFTNGLKIVFVGPTIPTSYENKTYYVSGVGTKIELIPVDLMIASEVSSEALYNPWGIIPWDISTWDVQLNVPINPDYITIERNSRDLNAWSRSNRWFHQDVLDITKQFLGYVSADDRNLGVRAKRPIIEYRANLKLFNSGSYGLGPVNLFDTSIKDAFSDVEGKTPNEVGLIDGQPLLDGTIIVFASDENYLVRKNIYRVDLVPAGNAGQNVIALSPSSTVPVQTDTQIFITDGITQKGTSWRFTNDNTWDQAQRKTSVNQYPQYDVFNQNNISLSDSEYYSATSFTGSSLFSYTPGSGPNDPVLGFPVEYSLPATIGDLMFTVNFNSDTFTYRGNNDSDITENINIGYVHYYPEPFVAEKLTGWVPAVGQSFQYQVFEFPITETYTTSFNLDVPAKTSSPYTTVVVYLNDNLLDQGQYSYTVNNVDATTTVNVNSEPGTKVTILVISDNVSKSAYYTVPTNLENNPLNENLTSVSVGDIRNQYRSIFINAPGVTGIPFGNNNIHDLPYYNNYGTKLIQNSASLVLPGLFLRKHDLDPFNSIQYSSEQYINYKNLIIDLVTNGDYSVYDSQSTILDDVIYNISKTKNTTTPFFWTDMMFSGNPYITNSYTFNTDLNEASFGLSDIWSPTMFSEANYLGLGVYLTRTVDNKQVVYQLMKNIDYTVSTTSPTLFVNFNILSGDVITVKEYNQTYGSYCPSTPSKLGLYPVFIPAVVDVPSFSKCINYIRGHDGSLTRLYGSYDYDTQIFSDIRDSVTFEFEQRIYNNIKVTGEIPLQFDDIVPGEFRTTEYTRQEILEIYSINFLNWIGANRLDYKSQAYLQNNPFTFNYNNSSNKLTDTALLQGNWRGIFNWFYDTDNPACAPWEMLGFVDKPSWWDQRYGPTPYTSGNTYMWQEIADGYVWNNGEPYINEKRIRPELLQVLPVDSSGTMLSPFQIMVSNYNKLTFQRDWVVGDVGPMEATYLNSSTWPYDLMKLMALTKPAKFFNLFVDRDRYKYSEEFQQYLYDNRFHLNPKTVQVYGNGTAKHSYINWVVDYVNQFGSNGTNVVTEYLKNLDVRLTYNLAGFSGKNYLKFLVEKATPNSKNYSLLIPDENYTVLLYDNPPEEIINYSSIVVQKISEGWQVYGNSKNEQYFTVVQPKLGYYDNLVVGTTSVQVSREWYPDRTMIVPYGTKFYSLQAVAEFVIDYGRYMTQQGVITENIIDGILYNWKRVAEEFLLWGQQSWEVGSVINLNPNAKRFTINRDGLVVQPMSFDDGNFLLNQNLLPIQAQNSCIEREGTSFTVDILNNGDSIAYSKLQLNSIEHAIVFDNATAFNDVIYNTITGLRQPRLLLQGYKTSEWNGYTDANGFILNENNIKEWEPNKKYPKNIIVIHKNNYYTALRLIEPAMEFSSEDWLLTDYDKIKTGILPNPSTVAYEAQYYYDSTRANLETDVDLLSFSLIGFRPRDYLTDVDLSDITQINVYKNILKTKGTNFLANSFKGAQFDQGAIDYDVQENWAIKNGTFGSVLNSNFIECLLQQSQLSGNPATLGFNTSGDNIPGVQQVVKISDLINYQRPPLTADFLPKYEPTLESMNGIPSAGFVNLDDVKFAEYSFDNLNDSSTNIANLYVNDYVWVANHNNSWDIFTTVSINTQLILLTNNLNGTVNLTFDNPHGLQENDLIAIFNFDDTVNGFYKVKSIANINTIVISLNLGTTVSKISSQGFCMKFVSVKLEQPSDAENLILPFTQWSSRKVWVNNDVDSNWAVYQAYPVYSQKEVNVNSDDFGISVAYSDILGQLVLDGNGKLYRIDNNGNTTVYPAGVGNESKVVCVGEYVYCSNPTAKTIIIYRYVPQENILELYQTLNTVSALPNFTGAIAVSSDQMYLYAADYINQRIGVCYLNPSEKYQFITTYTDNNVPIGSRWGYSLAVSTDGFKIIVGAPFETVDGLSQAGAVYVYNKRVQTFYCDGSTTSFTLLNNAPNNIGQIYVNDVIQTANVTISGNIVDFDLAPPSGAIVSVSTGFIEFAQKFTSETPSQNALFGNSIDTNRYGADILVGSPYEVATVDNVAGVEGGVYKFTNSGQRYGVVTGTVSGTQTGTILIDGYRVNFAGNIASIVDNINNQTPTNIIASYNGNTLTITVKENTPEVPYNILSITGSAVDIAKLGITPYQQTQVIRNFNHSNVSSFGYNVKMNEQDSLLISAITETKQQPTTFDLTENCNQDDTLFDNGVTIFVDSFENQGTVYNYTYLPAYQESITNPGKYVFGQYLYTDEISPETPQPKFGLSLAYKSNVILVGTPNWSSTQGGVASYMVDYSKETTCQKIKPSSWFIDKKPLPAVDINSLQTISLYNTLTNVTTDNLDYIDPLQGKLLGAIETNLDYMSMHDPAVYSDNGVSWLEDHVGDTWLDLTTIRLLDYHQPDISYNAKNWGKAFPGSMANIYTWIESTVKPINYAGVGFPLNYDNYTTSTVLDKSTNSLVTKYYFWVKNYDKLPPGKTLSPLVMSQYILNPLTSGISYLTPLTTNIVGLYNCAESIYSKGTALHLGYGIVDSVDDMHTSWNLIRSGLDYDFLPGLPTILGNQPSSLYLKFLESFAGEDASWNYIPDPRLPELIKYGTSFMPRQSMFIDRLSALKNYVDYANNILIKLPIVEIRSLAYLQKFGEIYDVRKYWYYTNYWSEGYSDDTKPSIEVNTYNDLLTILPNELIVSTGGANIFLEDGLVAKVHMNSSSRAEYYVYNGDTLTWDRIGVENGTIQLSDAIYGPYGWSSDSWGYVWDKSLAQEIYWIVRWLNEQCYVDDLRIERNRSLILMFNYIQSESLQQNNYLPWLNKTSLIDVKHKIRGLLPYKKFQRDNQEFLAGYLNEIKPFHVQIKNFIFSYDGLDVYPGNLTDFDLPAQYNQKSGNFESPQLVYSETSVNDEYTVDSNIWKEPKYENWFNNYGLSITNEEIGLYPVTQLVYGITSDAITARIKSAYGLPTVGTIIIDGEELSYNSIDYVSNTLLGLARGLNDTIPANHVANSVVYANLPSVVVLDSGRRYVEPPKIIAHIDTNIYPKPRVAAQLEPIMAGDKLIGISVIDSGSGYAVKPQIVIESSETLTFSSTAFNTTTNTITITGHDFINGDSVVYSHGLNSTAPLGLTTGEYYYIRVIDINTVALYENYRDAIISTEKVASEDTARVKFINQGTGNEQMLSITARAICFTSGHPVRELDINLRFNRVSYTTKITVWVSGAVYLANDSIVLHEGNVYRCKVNNSSLTFDINEWDRVYSDDPALTAADLIFGWYNPTVEMPAKDFSQLMTGMEYPNATISGEVFNPGWDGTPWDWNGDMGWDGPVDDPIVDMNLLAPAFLPHPIDTNYEIVGGLFEDGYGPEELVPGVITDTLNFTVYSNYSGYPNPSNPIPGSPINFRISLLNPQYTAIQTGETTVVSPGLVNDEIYLTDVTLILASSTATSGYVRIDNEIIYFGNVNLLQNKITELKRGLFGTIVNTQISIDTAVTGLDVISLGQVYNINPYTQTSLVSEFTTSANPYNDIMYVDDVTKLIDSISQTTGYVFVNGEYIQFFSVDLANNSISGLVRGKFGTITNSSINAGTIVQSVLSRDKLPYEYYTQWWYNVDTGSTDENVPFIDEPMNFSTHPAALFLKQMAP